MTDYMKIIDSFQDDSPTVEKLTTVKKVKSTNQPSLQFKQKDGSVLVAVVSEYFIFEPENVTIDISESDFSNGSIVNEDSFSKRNFNVFISWRKLKGMEGLTLTDALHQLNDDLGTRFKAGRFSDWESGNRFPCASVFRYIYTEVYAVILNSVDSFSAKEQKSLIRALSLPVSEKS